eukprot:TRINITY_DN55710_c0_g1_i1.p1 TRINITY_DN55710_c0_g1~~TRINITY_DN55710_c0_g1_i1.p1  ORF type:complete len:781 (-),score=157.70 TRINITY_DN55710_c0_g1_i1:130-2472(-)
MAARPHDVEWSRAVSIECCRDAGWVTALAAVPDVHTVACGTSTGTVGLHDATTGRRMLGCSCGAGISSMALTRGLWPSMLVAGDTAGMLSAFDLRSGELLLRACCKSWVTSVAYARDLELVLAGDGAGRLCALDLKAPPPPARAAGQHGVGSAAVIHDLGAPRAISSVIYAQEINAAVTGDWNGRMLAFDLRARRAVLEVRSRDGHGVSALDFDSRSSSVIAGDDGGCVRVWDVRTGRVRLTLPCGAPVSAVAYLSRMGGVVASTGGPRLPVFDARTGARSCDVVCAGPVASLAAAPELKGLLVGYGVGAAASRSPLDSSAADAASPTAGGYPTLGAAPLDTVKPAEAKAGAGVAGGAAIFCESVAARRALQRGPLSCEAVIMCMEAFSDGRTLVVADAAGGLSVFDVTAKTRRLFLRCGSGGEQRRGSTRLAALTALAGLPERRSVATGDDTGVVAVWDIATGLKRMEASPAKPGTWISALARLEEHRALAVGDGEGYVSVLDVESGHRRFAVATPCRAAVSALAYVAIVRCVAAGDTSGQVTLFDASTGEGHRTVDCGSAVSSLAVLPGTELVGVGLRCFRGAASKDEREPALVVLDLGAGRPLFAVGAPGDDAGVGDPSADDLGGGSCRGRGTSSPVVVAAYPAKGPREGPRLLAFGCVGASWVGLVLVASPEAYGAGQEGGLREALGRQRSPVVWVDLAAPICGCLVLMPPRPGGGSALGIASTKGSIISADLQGRLHVAARLPAFADFPAARSEARGPSSPLLRASALQEGAGDV